MPKMGYSSEDIQSRPLLDPGEYHFRVNEVRVVDGQAGKRDRMTLNMVVASGENAGFPVFVGFSLPTEDDKNTPCKWEEEQGMGDQTRNMAGFLLDFIKPAAAAMGVAWGKSGFNSDDFMGKECRATVAHRDYEGEMQMDVKGWKPLA